MSALLVAAALALAQDPPAARAEDMPDLSGKWLIVYAEEGGRRIQSWEQRQASVKNGTLTYTRDEKAQTIELKFGPKQTLKARQAEGVYIAARDYLCISLIGGTFAGDEDRAEGKADDGKGSGKFILILRRQR